MGIFGKENSIMYKVSFPGFKGQREREGEGERTERRRRVGSKHLRDTELVVFCETQ